jgi:CDP-diacylglycerol--serine O-phosphatidyltransferase
MARGARRRLGAQSINRLNSNSLTPLAPCAGIAARRFDIEGQWNRALVAIVVAAVLGGLGENDEPENCAP